MSVRRTGARQAQQRATGPGSERADAERARLHEMMALGEAERAVADVHMEDLKAAQNAARRRHIAAKGFVTRARRDGSAAKIAEAAEGEQRAYAEFMAVSDASIGEMFVVNRTGLDHLGALLDQIGRTWDADAEALDEITRRGPEAGQ